MTSPSHTEQQPIRRVISVNVGLPQTIRANQEEVASAIWKHPVSGRVALTRVNFSGDQQADLSVHGGPDKAVYAYAAEDLGWWQAELGREVSTGAVGENLTTAGVDLNEALIGERWAVGSVVLEVSQPRLPCFKLGIRFGDAGMPKRFADALRPGAYFRVIETGEIGAGDGIEIISRPGHQVTISLVNAAYHRDHHLAHRLLDAPQLPESWQQWAEKLARVTSQREG